MAGFVKPAISISSVLYVDINYEINICSVQP
jgi:hypothetical protein